MYACLSPSLLATDPFIYTHKQSCTRVALTTYACVRVCIDRVVLYSVATHRLTRQYRNITRQHRDITQYNTTQHHPIAQQINLSAFISTQTLLLSDKTHQLLTSLLPSMPITAWCDPFIS